MMGMDRLGLLGWAFAAVLMLSSCGSKHDVATDEMKPSPPPASVASSSGTPLPAQEFQEQDGIRVGIHPLHRRKEVKDRFGTDLMKKGYMPVRLEVVNEDHEGVIRLDPDAVFLVDPEGRRVQGASADYLFSKVKRSYGESVAMGVLFGGLGALASAASVASENEDLEAAIVGGALREKLIEPGDACKGFVYFPVPEDLYLLDGWRIELVLSNPGHKSYAFSRNLSGTTDYRGRKPLYMLKKELAAKQAKTRQQH